MLIETVGQRVRLVRPRSFAGLMTLYEGNHTRLRQLLGNLWHLPSRLVSTSSSDLSIHLTLDEHSRYTTSLRAAVERAAAGQTDRVLTQQHLGQVLPEVTRARDESCRVGPRRQGSSLANEWTEGPLTHRGALVANGSGYTFIDGRFQPEAAIQFVT